MKKNIWGWVRVNCLMLLSMIIFSTCDENVNEHAEVQYFNNYNETVTPSSWVAYCAENHWTPNEFKNFIQEHIRREKRMFRRKYQREYSLEDFLKAYSRWEMGWTPDEYKCPPDPYWKEYICHDYRSLCPEMYESKSIGSFKACMEHLFFFQKKYPPLGEKIEIKNYWFALWDKKKRYCAPIYNKYEMLQWKNWLTIISAWKDVIEPFARKYGYQTIFVIKKTYRYTCNNENLKMQKIFYMDENYMRKKYFLSLRCEIFSNNIHRR